MENNYQLSRIHNYINGLMSQEDMYALEREALDDPFLQDAIDGYRLQKGVDTKQLSLLQQRLAQRLARTDTHRSKLFYNWQRLVIGMTAGVLFITACTLLIIRYLPPQQTAVTNAQGIYIIAYNYQVTPVNIDTAPIGGWDKLCHALASDYSNSQGYTGNLDVQFQVDSEQKITHVRVTGEDFKVDEELIKLLQNQIQWQEGKAHFLIGIKKRSTL